MQAYVCTFIQSIQLIYIFLPIIISRSSTVRHLGKAFEVISLIGTKMKYQFSPLFPDRIKLPMLFLKQFQCFTLVQIDIYYSSSMERDEEHSRTLNGMCKSQSNHYSYAK